MFWKLLAMNSFPESFSIIFRVSMDNSIQQICSALQNDSDGAVSIQRANLFLLDSSTTFRIDFTSTHKFSTNIVCRPLILVRMVNLNLFLLSTYSFNLSQWCTSHPHIFLVYSLTFSTTDSFNILNTLSVWVTKTPLGNLSSYCVNFKLN